jgi:transcriptional regulator with XRE-family HTH domain
MSQTHRQHIGDNIRRLRTFRGLTQTGLAEKMGVAPSRISEWEAGLVNISVDSLAAIATALECSIDIIFEPIESADR